MGGGGKNKEKSRDLTQNCMKLKELRVFWNISREVVIFFVFGGWGVVINGSPQENKLTRERTR